MESYSSHLLWYIGQKPAKPKWDIVCTPLQVLGIQGRQSSMSSRLAWYIQHSRTSRNIKRDLVSETKYKHRTRTDPQFYSIPKLQSSNLEIFHSNCDHSFVWLGMRQALKMTWQHFVECGWKNSKSSTVCTHNFMTIISLLLSLNHHGISTS